MSAFMCSERHLSALVHYAVQNRVRWYAGCGRYANEVGGQQVLDILAQQNERSVCTRYTDENGGVAVTMRLGKREVLSPIQIIKLANSYDYQACETDDYRDTEAAKIVAAIRDEACRKLPGYEEASWAI